MTETFRCGDESGLVAFLYDECDPGERAAIAEHVAGCHSCAMELDSLAATRQQLALWAPPEARLGFRMTSDQVNTVVDARSSFGAGAATPASGSGPAGGSVVWWRQPLPAWAQVAAAALIFVAGLATGTARTDQGTASPALVSSDASARQQIAALERRVSGIERASQVRLVSEPASPDIEGRSDLVRWVRAEIDASERRQNAQLATQLLQMAWEDGEQQRSFEERVVTVVDQEVNSAFSGMKAAFLQR